MLLRKGRLNEVHFIDQRMVKKIGVVREEIRPARLEIEAWALSVAHKSGLNVPQVFDYYRDLDGREVLVLERIHGMPFSLGSLKGETVCMRDVGEQMKLLRNVSCGYGWVDPPSFVGRYRTWKSFLVSYTDFYGKRLLENGIFERDTLRDLLEAIERCPFSLEQPYLVHRDLKPGNLVKDDSGKIWIIDWENAMLGDPLYDIAIFGVREGHGAPWQNLVCGYEIDPPSPKYLLYEVVCLIGIIDFYTEYKLRYLKGQRQLFQLIRNLQNLS
ncbi:MAG: aminoglycoside phosphotransferase family protein [bacterium]|nr:aminoglycoside phosphotransferase family protein [bacterium]